MPLPKVSTPSYELKLLSTGKNIKYRPFLVKEEKVLLIALESGDKKQINSAIKDVLKSCILSRGVKVDELPTFELEYLFLNIRGKSVGESVELIAVCQDDGETQVPIKINISDVELIIPEGHTDTIDLGEGLFIQFKYPSMQQFIDNNFAISKETDKEVIDQAFKSVVACIDQIYTKDESWSASDCTDKELTSFIEQLNSAQFKEVENFFATMPKLSYTTNITNPNTGVESVIVVEGLSSFFA
jgi:hypothetical protein|tara:strand:+ start:4094 stop:4822 length:729 start_codon:yes stop_codon:yes gene_type:complete